jgi:hypothetical protein
MAPLDASILAPIRRRDVCRHVNTIHRKISTQRFCIKQAAEQNCQPARAKRSYMLSAHLMRSRKVNPIGATFPANSLATIEGFTSSMRRN